MNRLKEARKAKGLTQKEVAEYIGIGQVDTLIGKPTEVG